MCPLCQHEKYYVLPLCPFSAQIPQKCLSRHNGLYRAHFHNMHQLSTSWGFLQYLWVPKWNFPYQEVLCNLLTRSTDCWFNFTGINAGPSVVLCSCAVVIQSKTYVLLKTKESNIYLLLQGPEFKPHASLIQQLTNSLLPGLYCKNNFFSFNKNLHQHVVNHTVEPNRLGKLYRSILHIHVMLWQLALCNPISCNVPTFKAKLFCFWWFCSNCDD